MSNPALIAAAAAAVALNTPEPQSRPVTIRQSRRKIGRKSETVWTWTHAETDGPSSPFADAKAAEEDAIAELGAGRINAFIYPSK